MIGTPSKLSVRVTRKVGDNEFGSVGVEAELTVELAPDANLDETFNGVDSFLSAAVGMSVTEKIGNIKKTQAEKAEQTALPQPKEEDEPLRPKTDSKDAKEGDELDFVCVKFGLEKTPEKKYRLLLYPKIGEGPGKFATIKYTAERERMWNMIAEVADAYSFDDLPVEFECNWLVHYKIGKEGTTADGKKFHYKDLLAIKGM